MSREDKNALYEQEMLFPKLTRRSFLKTTGALAGTAALAVTISPALQAIAVEEDAETLGEEVFYGIDRCNCEGACRFKITSRDGRPVKVELGEYPNPEYNRICAKGMSNVQVMYNPRRVKAPLKRAGDRGAGEWEEISWDEALDLISTTWKDIIDTHGPGSIAFSAGTGNAGYSNRLSTKLVNLIGASQVHYCYDMAFNYGSENALGIGNGWNINEGSYFHKTNCFIVWGANMSEAHPHYWHFVLESVQNGAKMIVIDPVYTITASKADLWVPIRPCTDSALFMCLTNLAIQNDRHDIPFMKELTVGPFLVKESDGKYLRQSDLGVTPTEGPINPQTGKPTIIDPLVVRAEDGRVAIPEEIKDPVIEGTFTVEGIEVTTAFSLLKKRVAEWTLSKTAEICDISEEMITEVYETMIENSPVVSFQGFGPDHYGNGHYPYYASQCMLAVTGNLAKDGASGGNGFAWDNAFRMITYTINGLPRDKGFRAGPAVIPTNKLAETIQAGKIGTIDVDLKSIYFWVHNPIGNIPNRLATLEAFEKLEFIVVADTIMSDTARYADLVLPAAHMFEYTDMFIAGSPFATLSEKVCDPLFEAKCDYDIFSAIGHAMGFGEYFTDSNEEFLAKHFASGIGGITWEQFNKEKTIWGPVKRLGIDMPPPTPTKRFQFYRETVAPNLDIGQTLTPEDINKERMPYWEPPLEAWSETVGGYPKHELADKYPLIYTTERSKLKTHTQYGYNQWLLELIPEPIVKISTKDAEDRGVATGDYVKMFNDRGHVVLKAVVNDGIRTGMLVVPKGWQEDQFQEGHYSNLNNTHTNKVCINNNFFDSLVQLEKA